jgi:hypothetical protein
MAVTYLGKKKNLGTNTGTHNSEDCNSRKETKESRVYYQ